MKILSVGAKLFYEDGRSDRRTDGHDEVNIRSHNFANTSKQVTYMNLFILRWKYFNST
jgi:hypothetical protein